MNSCIFCDILARGGGAIIWEDDCAAVFHDIHPKAPIHVLVVPKKHIVDLNALDDERESGRLLMAVAKVAEKLGIAEGYRVAINNGRAAGQIVEHLHLHLLGSKSGFESGGAETD